MNLLVFDVDGRLTLTATNEVDTRCFARAFFEAFGIGPDTRWHVYPHRTDSGIICHSFSQHFKHFRRAPTSLELALFRERVLILLESEWRGDPRNFTAIAGAVKAFTEIAQPRGSAFALATGSRRASALFKLEKADIHVAGLPAAFADDATEREEIARIAIARVRITTSNSSMGSFSWGIPIAMSLRPPA